MRFCRLSLSYQSVLGIASPGRLSLFRRCITFCNECQLCRRIERKPTLSVKGVGWNLLAWTLLSSLIKETEIMCSGATILVNGRTNNLLEFSFSWTTQTIAFHITRHPNVILQIANQLLFQVTTRPFLCTRSEQLRWTLDESHRNVRKCPCLFLNPNKG